MGAFTYPPSESLRKKGYWSAPGVDFDAEGRQRQYTARIREMEKNLGMRIAMEQKPLNVAADVTQFITKVKQAYTSSISENMRLGDVVRARVVQVRPSLQLSTAGAELGVVKARCTKCRSFLIKEGGKLYCGECGALEHRKLSEDYRDITFKDR